MSDFWAAVVFAGVALVIVVIVLSACSTPAGDAIDILNAVIP